MLLLAASVGLLDDIVERTGDLAGSSSSSVSAAAYDVLDILLARVREREGDLLDKISESGLMGDASRERLEAALKHFLAPNDNEASETSLECERER